MIELIKHLQAIKKDIEATRSKAHTTEEEKDELMSILNSKKKATEKEIKEYKAVIIEVHVGPCKEA